MWHLVSLHFLLQLDKYTSSAYASICLFLFFLQWAVSSLWAPGTFSVLFIARTYYLVLVK